MPIVNLFIITSIAIKLALIRIALTSQSNCTIHRYGRARSVICYCNWILNQPTKKKCIVHKYDSISVSYHFLSLSRHMSLPLVKYSEWFLSGICLFLILDVYQYFKFLNDTFFFVELWVDPDKYCMRFL